MKRIAKFEKVSFNQYLKDLCACYGTDPKDEKIIAGARKMYDAIRLPERATAGSAGYDFFTPNHITIEPGKTKRFPTGIRCFMDDGYVLLLAPRSGLGFKYRMQLDNTLGIIDGDYSYAENEGHIQAKFTNDSRDEKTVDIPAGTAYMQGVFVPYGITLDDHAVEKRTGGIGSTTK